MWTDGSSMSSVFPLKDESIWIAQSDGFGRMICALMVGHVNSVASVDARIRWICIHENERRW